MSKNWAEIIKARGHEYLQKQQEITNCLEKLMTEARQVVGKAFVEKTSNFDLELGWKIVINNKAVIVNYREIIEAQKIYDANEMGNIVEVEKTHSIEEALIRLILDKFKWLPDQ